MRKYKVGFFGGKFFPFTRGHFLCLKKLAEECEQGVCILFLNGKDEAEYIRKNGLKFKWLAAEERIKQVNSACRKFPNLRFTTLYCDVIYENEELETNWDKETNFVRSVVGSTFDVIYSSEPSYSDYFKKAYPFAKHILIDPKRAEVPISATMIREGGEQMYKKWGWT